MADLTKEQMSDAISGGNLIFRTSFQTTYTEIQELVIGQLMATRALLETEKERAECQAMIERVKKDPIYAEDVAEYMYNKERAKQGDTQAQRELDDQLAKAHYQQQVLRALEAV